MTAQNRNKQAAAGVAARFNEVRAFFIDRGVRHYMSVFAAFDAGLDGRKDDITAWWNGRARLTAGDEPTLVVMESVVERIKNDQQAA